MLVDHQVKRILLRMPFARRHPGGEFPTLPKHADAVDHFLRRTAGKSVGKPRDLMTALHEPTQIRQRHPFSPAGQGVTWITPVEHQKTHEGRSVLVRHGGDNEKGRLTKRPFFPKTNWTREWRNW